MQVVRHFGGLMKTNRRYIATVMWLLLMSPTSYADGNKLLEQCLVAERYYDNKEVPYDFMDLGVCMGFVQGVRNTMYILSYNRPIDACMPDGISNGQALRVVTAYLKKHPELLHEHEANLTVKAFNEAYPCKK